jgi:hypothetical protein
VTDIVAGEAVEYHVCDEHLQELDALKPAAGEKQPATGVEAFWKDPDIHRALRDPEAREKMAAYLLPPLCLGLVDPKPEVRICSAYGLMLYGPNAQSAVGALRDALRDSDERVRRVADIALELIETGKEPFCLPQGVGPFR